MIQFTAEVREVKSKKLITNDIEFTVKLNTDNQEVLKLALIPADKTILVTIEENDTK